MANIHSKKPDNALIEIIQYSEVEGKELSSFVAVLHSNFHTHAL